MQTNTSVKSVLVLLYVWLQINEKHLYWLTIDVDNIVVFVFC